MPNVTPKEMDEFNPILKNPGSKREGQVLAGYDRVYGVLKAAVHKFGFKTPAVFESSGVDRRSSIYFNTNKEVITSMLYFHMFSVISNT